MMVKGRQALVLLLVAALSAAILTGIDKTTFSTSVIDLLPGDNSQTDILKELADRDQGRQLTVRLSDSTGPVKDETVAAFKESLLLDPAIRKAWIPGGEIFSEAGTILFENRYIWLLAAWLEENVPDWEGLDSTQLSELLLAKLESYLQSPEGFVLADTIPQDPFLLLGRAMEMRDFIPGTKGTTERFLWVEQAASPFIEAGQEPVFKALKGALQVARAEQPNLNMEFSGVAVFASASKTAIKSEIEHLNLLGILFVLGLTAFIVRRSGAVIRIFLVVLIALLAASAAVLTMFSSVHVISLVIGSILTGIAVDYGFHLVLIERGRLPDKSVLKAVITGSISSALGFVVLVWAPLPFLRQVGTFVSCGLLAALLAALLLRHDNKDTQGFRSWHINPFALPGWTGPILILLLLPGLVGLHWRDSIRELEYPLPEIAERDAELRQASTSSVLQRHALYLVAASDVLEARDRLDGVDREVPGLIHLGKWIPGYAQARSVQELFQTLDDFPATFSQALEEADYLSETFAPFFRDWQNYIGEDLDRATYRNELSRFSEALPGSLGSLLHIGDSISWIMVLAPASGTSIHHPDLFKLDQEKMLSGVFASFRKSMVVFAGFCLLVLSLGVIIAYGFLNGILAVALPCIAIFAAMGGIGYGQESIGLFNVVGALLAYCISLDYSLFAVDSHRKRFRLPGSVAISAMTTIGIFGILTMSHIPAVKQLGLTVLMVVSISLLMIISGWPWVRRGAVPARGLIQRLPHGREAWMIGATRHVMDSMIEVDVRVNQYQAVPVECCIEVMAQAGALLLAHRRGKNQPPRGGLLVVVQECQTYSHCLKRAEPCIAEVECRNLFDDGLLVFDGKCKTEEGATIAEATFSVIIAPTPASS